MLSDERECCGKRLQRDYTSSADHSVRWCGICVWDLCVGFLLITAVFDLMSVVSPSSISYGATPFGDRMASFVLSEANSDVCLSAASGCER